MYIQEVCHICLSVFSDRFLFYAQINSLGHVEPSPEFIVSFKRHERPRLEPKNLGIQVNSLTTTPQKLIAVDPAFDRSRNTFNM